MSGYAARAQPRRRLDAVEALLRAHGWPGNVRELERFVERAVTLTENDPIDMHDLPAEIRGVYAEVFGPPLTSNSTMRAWGSRYATLVFERCGRNKRRACEQLDISYHTLQAYLQYADRDQARTPPSRWTRPMPKSEGHGPVARSPASEA